MDWKSFKEGVKVLITTDGTRLGADQWVDAQIRACAIDLQREIPSYQIDHETFYTHEELALESDEALAAFGTVPAFAHVKEWWNINSDDAEDASIKNRVKLKEFPWPHRQELIEHGIKRYGPRYTIGPDRKDFYITPPLDEEHLLLIKWDGIQREWVDANPVPFPPSAIQAAYYWVKGMARLDLDSNNNGVVFFREDARNPGLYQTERNALWREANAR